MSDPLKIAAVFATMNRATTAVACVRALAAQTRPPERVIVADNVSSDDTVNALESLTDLPFELVVHRMPGNRGNAGGVEEAMEQAFARGADAVWILDDDSWPRPGALEAMLENPWDPQVVRHPLQIDPRSGCFTWPMWVQKAAGWELAFDEKDLPLEPMIASKSSWTGALVSKEVRDKVGRVNAGLFIRGEDEEYPWRITQKDFRFVCARKAIIDHPGPDSLVHWRFFGKNLFLEKGLVDWKLYYKTRNMVWLKLRQSGWVAAITMAIAYAIAISWLDGVHRLPLIVTATCDGLVGRLGKWENH